MKHINFKNLKIKNFLSVGEDPVHIDFNTGVNIITGVNKDKDDRRNGVGKSTIADAIYFTIFGTTIREIKKENICNNQSTGQTETCLDLCITENQRTTEYRIVRVLNPSKCYLYVDGVDKTRDSISNTSKYITDMLCSTPDVFQNCVIMTLNNTIPFMAQKKNDKRKFIEGILNLQVFGDMLQLAKSEYNEHVKELEISCAKYETTSNQIESLTAQKKKQNDDIKDRVHILQNRKKQNDTEIQNLKSKPEINITMSVADHEKKIDQLKNSLVECTTKHTKIITNISSLQTKNEHVENTISKIITGDSTCPSCLRPLADHDKKMIESEKQTLTEQITINTQHIDTHRDKLKKINDVQHKITDSIKSHENTIQKQKIQIKEKDNLLKRITQLKSLNKQIDSDIMQVLSNKSSFDGLIDESVSKLSEIQVEIDQVKQTINKLDVVKFVVSEEGVRSYIVKKILQLLNGKLAYYLKKMDANCMCVFNEYFEEQIIDEKGKICSYHNFSGAERKNIDLACLFAFMDIRRLQGDVAFNFSVYDELLDSSLDERGIELVLDILRERVEKYNECVMVISHRKESVKFATNDIIFLEKNNGVTRRVDQISTHDK